MRLGWRMRSDLTVTICRRAHLRRLASTSQREVKPPKFGMGSSQLQSPGLLQGLDLIMVTADDGMPSTALTDSAPAWVDQSLYRHEGHESHGTSQPHCSRVYPHRSWPNPTDFESSPREDVLLLWTGNGRRPRPRTLGLRLLGLEGADHGST